MLLAGIMPGPLARPPPPLHAACMVPGGWRQLAGEGETA